MKKNILYLLMSLSLQLFPSCELNDFKPEEWAVDPELKLSESGIVASSIGEKYLISVTTNYKDFIATSNQSWCTPTVDVGNRTIEIKVDSNEGADQRTSVVTVSVSRGKKSLSKDITIYQVGGKWDVVAGTDIRLRWAYDVSESQKKIISEQLRQLVYVEGGTFLMGVIGEDPRAPKVTLSDYYIGKYEVTQEQWAAVMATSPSRFTGGRKPIENITWDEAQTYVTKLANLTGLTIKLPTSAQWEFAARGGKYSLGFSYAGSNDPNSVGHYLDYGIEKGSPLYTTVDVGSKNPNELGIYDMSGNVSELCSDWYGDIPSGVELTDPTGPNTGYYHLERGGNMSTSTSWRDLFHLSKFATRDLDKKESFVGLRIVLKK